MRERKTKEFGEGQRGNYYIGSFQLRLRAHGVCTVGNELGTYVHI